jgi:hypothetical protein
MQQPKSMKKTATPPRVPPQANQEMLADKLGFLLARFWLRPQPPPKNRKNNDKQAERDDNLSHPS